jgi:hypothetical protein
MNAQKLLVKFLVPALVAGAAQLIATEADAQVKIGTNPTVIDLNNNLEVEASTANRKTFINKTSGQVTIKDGTEGATKVFTSDANGGGSWQAPGVQNTPVIVFERRSGSPFQTLPPEANNAITKVNFTTEVFDKGNDFNSATDTFTVPADGTGYYQISGIFASQLQSHNLGASFFIYVNGSNRRYLAIGNSSPGAGITAGGNAIVHLDAGDLVDIRVTTTTDDVNLTLCQLDILFVSK